jgi:putative component of toxin-antitoxin plasmid stabilization module
MPITKEYIENNGQSPFAKWFDDLNSEAAAKVTTALYRLEQGNFSRVEGVGGSI